MVLFSITINNITTELLLSNQEEFAYGVLTKIELRKNVERDSKSLIENMIKLAKDKQRGTFRGGLGLRLFEEREKMLAKKSLNLHENLRKYSSFGINTRKFDNMLQFDDINGKLKILRLLTKAIHKKSQELDVLASDDRATMAGRRKGISAKRSSKGPQPGRTSTKG